MLQNPISEAFQNQIVQVMNFDEVVEFHDLTLSGSLPET